MRHQTMLLAGCDLGGGEGGGEGGREGRGGPWSLYNKTAHSHSLLLWLESCVSKCHSHDRATSWDSHAGARSALHGAGQPGRVAVSGHQFSNAYAKLFSVVCVM